MKKITLLLLCFVGFAASAQVTFKPGIRAGANLSRITQSDFDTRSDFYVGGFGAIKFTRFYTLQPEINYSRQGGKGEGTFYDWNTSTNIPFKGDIEIQYLSFGLINKFTFNDAINIHVGPFFDFETGSNVNTNAEVDLGITAGVGYTLPFGLTIEARVKKGLIDVLESDDYSDFYYTDNYNTNFMFQLGLSYSFGGLTGTTK